MERKLYNIMKANLNLYAFKPKPLDTICLATPYLWIYLCLVFIVILSFIQQHTEVAFRLKKTKETDPEVVRLLPICGHHISLVIQSLSLLCWALMSLWSESATLKLVIGTWFHHSSCWVLLWSIAYLNFIVYKQKII